MIYSESNMHGTNRNDTPGGNGEKPIVTAENREGAVQAPVLKKFH